MRFGNIESRNVRLHNPARRISPGCDPVVNIAGANFPSWLFCAICGAILTLAIRPIFVVTRLEPYLWPPPIVYSSLTVLLGCIVWLIFFNRI